MSDVAVANVSTNQNQIHKNSKDCALFEGTPIMDLPRATETMAASLSRLLKEATVSTDQADSSPLTTDVETYLNVVLGIAFGITASVALRRMMYSRSIQRAQQQLLQNQRQAAGAAPSSGAASSSTSAETTVVTAFYSLILLTSVFRAVWFLIPSVLWKPEGYTPSALSAFEQGSTAWISTAASEIMVTTGSLSLFSIFILILVYWADILKKYFHPGSRRVLPMMTFLSVVGSLAAIELINVVLFLCGRYTTEGMTLFNALVLAAVSIICVAEITIFSHRFRTVLQTLGAINQVSTDSQVRRIVWITVTGNLFFVTRAGLELVFAVLLLLYYHSTGTVARPFSHSFWDMYTLVMYGSEVAILSLMLYILQSRFSSGPGTATPQQPKTSYGTMSSSGGRMAAARNEEEVEPLNV
jgi:hypothetical protein